MCTKETSYHVSFKQWHHRFNKIWVKCIFNNVLPESFQSMVNFNHVSTVKADKVSQQYNKLVTLKNIKSLRF